MPGGGRWSGVILCFFIFYFILLYIFFRFFSLLQIHDCVGKKI